MSQRPKLKRETAQDIEDEDCVNDHKMVHLSPNSLLKPTKQKQLIHQKSAPGTPMSPNKKFSLSSHHRTPSRTPSDESSTSGYLSEPKQRLRGSSLSGDSELSLSLNNVYLLRQFSIAGRKVIHVGDSLHQRTISS